MREKPFYFQSQADLEFTTDVLSKAEKVEIPLKVESCSIKYIAPNATRLYSRNVSRTKNLYFPSKNIIKRSFK